MKPPSFSSTEAPVATLRARPSSTRREAVGSQIAAASNLPARNPLVITSMFWFRYSAGLMFFFSNTARANRSVHAPLGTATVLPSIHWIASSELANSGASVLTSMLLHWSIANPAVATIRTSATRSFVVATIAGISPM